MREEEALNRGKGEWVRRFKYIIEMMLEWIKRMSERENITNKRERDISNGKRE